MFRRMHETVTWSDTKETNRVGVCMLCVGDIEEINRGVGAGVNDTILSETP